MQIKIAELLTVKVRSFTISQTIYPINHFSRGNNLDKTMFRVCLFILNFFIFFFGGNIKRQRREVGIKN